jgi:hypothetical protein
MIQTAIVALPALAALIICIRRGPERALLDVYVPTLLLLPQSCLWPISGQLSFAGAAILPISAFLILRSHHEWDWTLSDFLVIGYVALMAISEGMNSGYKLGQNMAIHELCSILLPYFAVKEALGTRQFSVDFAKRIVVSLCLVAIISIYEFRMGSDLFLSPLARIFPAAGVAPVVFRAGFMRVQGPYSHAILAGVMMAVGYRIARALDWSGEWTGRLPFLPISKVRFCEFWIIVGSIMTLSVGPWVGAAGGAVAISICRARNRRRALTMLILTIALAGWPIYSAVKAYVSVDRMVAVAAGDRLQEDSAYRGKLLPLYIPLVEERPTWGWGQKGFPVLHGMYSIDNDYLLTALSFGVYALALLVVILASTPIRLGAFALRLPRAEPATMTAYTLIAVYAIIALSIATVWMGMQLETLLFLMTGWSDRLVSKHVPDKVTDGALASDLRGQIVFRRVMA